MNKQERLYVGAFVPKEHKKLVDSVVPYGGTARLIQCAYARLYKYLIKQGITTYDPEQSSKIEYYIVHGVPLGSTVGHEPTKNDTRTTRKIRHSSSSKKEKSNKRTNTDSKQKSQRKNNKLSDNS